MSAINENLKKKIDELDLDRRINEATENAEVLLKRALATAGGLAHEHRDDVDRVLDKVTAVITERTEGKYTEQVEKVRGTVDTGLERLAQRREDDGTA